MPYYPPDLTAPTGTAGGDLGGTYPNPDIGTGVIVNADVNASAAIAKTKLASLDVMNADVNTSAAIAYSKLNLASSVVSGDLVDGTVAMGDLTAAVQALLPIIVRKTADQTVNNSSVAVNDTHLVLPVLANSTYTFELQLLLSAANQTADWKFSWTYPASTTMFWAAHIYGGGSSVPGTMWDANSTAATTQISALWIESTVGPVGGVTGIGGMFFRGIIRVAGTAGNVQLQWAQNTANATDSKVLTDSVLIARKIA